MFSFLFLWHTVAITRGSRAKENTSQKRDFHRERKSYSILTASIKAGRNRAIPNPTQVCLQMTCICNVSSECCDALINAGP